MGIPGLLQLLGPATLDTHVRSLAGKRVAIDAYCWLHRGTYGCALDLAQGRDTDLFVNFCMKRVAMLTHFGVTPVMVFDGAPLPSKLAKEREREE